MLTENLPLKVIVYIFKMYKTRNHKVIHIYKLFFPRLGDFLNNPNKIWANLTLLAGMAGNREFGRPGRTEIGI